MKLRNHFSVVIVYLLVVAATFSLATLRMRAQGNAAAQPAASPAAAPQPSPSVKPNFNLSTNRTYGTQEKTRIYINYHGVNYLDFRVYRVNDPVKFFKQLNNPHQLGQADTVQISSTYQGKPSALENLREFKGSLWSTIKNYIRSQLRRESRTAFNDKFRAGEQVQLGAAEFAQIPLLNSDQLRQRFRQVLTPLENQSDTRMVPLGQLEAGVYLVEAVNDKLRAYTIAVVTDLTTVSKIAAASELLIYTVDRKSGEPRANAKIEIVARGRTLAAGTTDKDGLLRTRIKEPEPIPTPAPTATPKAKANAEPAAEAEGETVDERYLIMAARDNEFSIADLESYYFERDEEGNVTSYIYTDRPVYRPEQKVYFKGILRLNGEAGYELIRESTVRVRVEDADNKPLIDKQLPLSARGTFSGEVELGAGAPLGNYNIIASTDSVEARGYFDVAEYKKPEFKVKVTTPEKYVAVGTSAKFTVEAKYFFGSPVTNAEVKYYVYRSRYQHWWWHDEDDDPIGASDEEEGGDDYYGYGNDMVKEGEGKLDANGRFEIAFDVPQPDDRDVWDYTYRLEAEVTDAARRSEQARGSFTGVRGKTVALATPERYVYFQGETARVKIRTADFDGKPLATKVTLRFQQEHFERVEKKEDGYTSVEYKPIRKDLSGGEVTTNAQGEAQFDYRVPVVGSIRIETIVAEGNRQVRSSGGYLYVTDRNNGWADAAVRDYDSIKLIPDKKSYRPGNKAQVLAMLPVANAHLLVTIELNKVVKAWTIKATGRAALLEVPIESSYVPNVYLSVAYVRNGELFTADKLLAVPASNKFLNLEVIPDKPQYKPRDPASYTIVARNADGTPAAGVEVSLGVVDEAIYSIQPDAIGDIRRAFYGRRYSSVNTSFSPSYQFTGYSGDKVIKLALNKRSRQLADFKNENQYAEPTIRKDFKDTAFWQPDVVTGADGKATVKLQLPDNLTTWRATARAVTTDLRVGSRIARAVARKDLILRLETPRFLTEGDTAVISGIVHNYLDADKTTQIELQVSGNARLLDAAQQTVSIKQQGEQRIDWRIAAAQVGSISLLATAKTDAESDGVELPLEVVPGGLHQTKGGVTTLAEENAEKVLALDLPINASVQARSLRVEASPSIAASMFGALDYLTGYPYGCTEQTMSSFLPNVIVAQALKEVKSATLRDTASLGKKVQRGLDRLYGYQHEDGGWGWWKDDQTDPFMTAYVVDGLSLARGAGFAVDNYRLNRARERISKLLAAGKNEQGRPIDPEDRAYLVYALNSSGEEDVRFVNDLFNKRSELQPYGRALLALALRARGDEQRAKQVAAEIERAARSNDFDAHWESKRRPLLDFYEENDVEATALSLKALAQLAPQSTLLGKAARWLVANRRNGYYWDSTKQTAFAIFGLIDYLKASKELSPDYTVEIFLNGELVLSKRITAVEAGAGQTLLIERKGAALGNANQLRVLKQGKGTLYVSSALDYYTKDDAVAAQGSQSLKLSREYLRLTVSEGGGKPGWKVEPLTGELRSGDLLVSRLRLQGAKARYVLIEDPIPAGCEQVAQVGGLSFDYGISDWSNWYSSREFRDRRTAIFTDYFDGDDMFQYAMRVITPGEFRVAPARAELMYQPTVQSNTANFKLNLLDKR